MSPPTCYHGQSCDAGERRDVNIHALQVRGKLRDSIYPFSKSTHALEPVQDHSITKDKFAFHWVGPAINNKVPLITLSNKWGFKGDPNYWYIANKRRGSEA